MKHYITSTNPMRQQFDAMASYSAAHFSYAFTSGVATITLNRPERKNPLTFDSYQELRNLFAAFNHATDVKAVVLTGEGGNFCSGGDVHEIIGPLTKMSMTEMLEFTRMTGDLVKQMRLCPQPIIAAIDGIGCRPATGHTTSQNGLPVHPRWSGGCRHGRVCTAAAHDWPGSRVRASFFWPRRDGARRFAVGVF